MDPLYFLRLLRTVSDTHAYVKGLCGRKEKFAAKAKKASKHRLRYRKAAAATANLFDDIAALTLQKSKRVGRHSGRGGAGGGEEERKGYALGGNDEGEHFEGDDGEDEGDEMADTNADLGTLRRRLVLHERVQTLARLRKTQMGQQVAGLTMPSKFLHVDPFWQVCVWGQSLA